jgi:MFS transporter, OFA family, oxalate/formate antiporter
MLSSIRTRLAARVYYGWVIVAACFLASMVVFGTTYAFGVFYDSFIEEFDVSRTLLAAVFGLQSALIYVAGVLAGELVDRYGQRLVLSASSVVLVTGLVWTAFARSYLELLAAFGVLAAVGMAGLYVVGYATIPLWFDRRRGTAAGFASAGLGVGLAVVPPGADLAISAVGWRGAVLALAGTAGLVLAVATALFADRPADVGATLDAEFEPEQRSESTERERTDGAGADAWTIARSRPFLLVFLGWVLIFTSLYVVMSHVVLYATDAGLGRQAGVVSIVVIGVATTGTRLAVGFVGDRFGRSRTFVCCAGLMGASVVGLALSPTVALFLGAVFVFGIGYGGCGGLLGPLVADLFGRAQLNTLFAIMSVSFAVSGLLAPPLAGWLFELLGTYRPVFALFGLLSVLGSGCVLVSGRLDRQRVRDR